MIRFLKRLLRRFVGSASGGNLASTVEPRELLARFFFSREDFVETKALVKPKAFLPDKTGETSVFRITALSSEAVWSIGHSIRDVRAKARGDLLHSVVQRIGLRVDPAPEEHPRHAVIVGWPEQKHDRLMLATLLSKEAVLHVAESMQRD
jgi:hypothetical protein